MAESFAERQAQRLADYSDGFEAGKPRTVAQYQIRVKGEGVGDRGWINCPTEVLYESAMKSGLYDGRTLYELDPNTREQDSQHVLKAEAARPDATDRETPAHASPDGGPMGVGQPAAAGPAKDRSTFRRDLAYDSYWPETNDDTSVYGIWCAAWKACEDASPAGDPRPALSALLYAVTTASASGSERATAEDRSEAGCAYEVAERAIAALASSVPPEQQREHKS